jgi:hypothetical protein
MLGEHSQPPVRRGGGGGEGAQAGNRTHTHTPDANKMVNDPHRRRLLKNWQRVEVILNKGKRRWIHRLSINIHIRDLKNDCTKDRKPSCSLQYKIIG